MTYTLYLSEDHLQSRIKNFKKFSLSDLCDIFLNIPKIMKIIPTYEDIFKKFSEKGCRLTMTKEEFNEITLPI